MFFFFLTIFTGLILMKDADSVKRTNFILITILLIVFIHIFLLFIFQHFGGNLFF